MFTSLKPLFQLFVWQVGLRCCLCKSWDTWQWLLMAKTSGGCNWEWDSLGTQDPQLHCVSASWLKSHHWSLNWSNHGLPVTANSKRVDNRIMESWGTQLASHSNNNQTNKGSNPQRCKVQPNTENISSANISKKNSSWSSIFLAWREGSRHKQFSVFSFELECKRKGITRTWNPQELSL